MIIKDSDFDKDIFLDPFDADARRISKVIKHDIKLIQRTLKKIDISCPEYASSDFEDISDWSQALRDYFDAVAEE